MMGSESEDEYLEASANQRKRRRFKREGSEADILQPANLRLSLLLDAIDPNPHKLEASEDPHDTFDQFIEDILPELLLAKTSAEVRLTEQNEYGQSLKPLSRKDARNIVDRLTQNNTGLSVSFASSLVTRRLKMQPGLLRRLLLDKDITNADRAYVTPLPAVNIVSTANKEVIDALYAIRTTPYECSFLSRLQGFQPSHTLAAIAVDWETRSPWIDLMSDIREHFFLLHPEREQPIEIEAPIEYVALHPSHLPQVHDLLARTFWDGIDVSDALDYSPERSTVVAMYKRLVVGVVFVSSPQQLYITYLAVRTGWENAHIATSMLYHLIALNPNRDITLHVSTNNPAMVSG
ncbi:uncharacterized protein FIBRA_04666 [Fibroporia radiculosa]|uniref:N-acetyltransferase domain-containing protein n=1 Tax=Fibroporia radiculosa TaxID=599839 RepID=J4G7R4_9APHY|nr:uncharacterized protein FIBRA_04666 [Fibroporia radiculosa]CCM02563.1 predicted protein [Fibroporia radiculosa]